MRCSCPKCGTYMIQAESLRLGCVCPECGTHCSDCLGTDTVIGEKVNNLQWSVGGGLGLEFNVSGRFGIFAEPSVKYYFDCGQPKSIRTDKPFQMVLRLGVRFEL